MTQSPEGGRTFGGRRTNLVLLLLLGGALVTGLDRTSSGNPRPGVGRRGPRCHRIGHPDRRPLEVAGRAEGTGAAQPGTGLLAPLRFCSRRPCFSPGSSIRSDGPMASDHSQCSGCTSPPPWYWSRLRSGTCWLGRPLPRRQDLTRRNLIRTGGLVSAAAVTWFAADRAIASGPPPRGRPAIHRIARAVLARSGRSPGDVVARRPDPRNRWRLLEPRPSRTPAGDGLSASMISLPCRWTR